MNSLPLIKLGDTVAFQEVFYEWRPKIYGYLQMKCQDTATAEELTQIVFIKLWEDRHKFSDQYTVEVQLFRIARNAFIDHLRARARQRKLHLEVGQLKEKLDYQHSFDYQHRITSALQALPPIRKKVFILSRMEGLSYKEIAGQLSISDRTVEKHISMAIKQLKKILIFISILLQLKY